MIIDAPSHDDIPLLRSLWKEAFGDGEKFLDAFFSTAFSPDRARCAKENGDILAMLYWFDCEYEGEHVAYLYAVATAKVCRGRGICTSLMKNAHRHLKEKGYTGALLVPGTGELFAFYEKLGYKTACYVNEFSALAVNEDFYIEKINKDKYAELRRSFLPDGSVLQEKANIDFLNFQASFYTGDGFLLAAHREGKMLFGVELLGNAEKAPQIAGALGSEVGKFRTPGSEKPFAMYLPLAEKEKKPPTYFGLAFD